MEPEKQPEIQEEKQEETTSNSDDWDRRVLCSDGNCIGVIGADGRCKECGKIFEGDLPEMSPAEDEVETGQEDAEPSAEADEPTEETDAGPDDEWENRVLCSDGNCIGVIGSDGKCKECGKPLE
ncbi:hypothetical protein D1AOALGA4SA_3969 [Olavius algarvensis Delta 1 endosymbiont]|nr:hypothetical protein D1AOALGA4SA_3969 [Olavius algarvensis Delta 1 endosymbiont]